MINDISISPLDVAQDNNPAVNGNSLVRAAPSACQDTMNRHVMLVLADIISVAVVVFVFIIVLLLMLLFFWKTLSDGLMVWLL